MFQQTTTCTDGTAVDCLAAVADMCYHETCRPRLQPVHYVQDTVVDFRQPVYACSLQSPLADLLSTILERTGLCIQLLHPSMYAHMLLCVHKRL